MNKTIIPVVTGKTAQELVDQYQQARSHIDSILDDDLLKIADSHYRPDEVKTARLQRGCQVSVLCAIRGDINTIIEGILDQIAAEPKANETVQEEASRTGRPEGEVQFERSQGRPWDATA